MSSTLLAYRPVRPAAPALVRRRDVDPLTWTGMVLDGVLVPLWRDVAVRAGEPVTPALRVAAVADVVPRRAVVGRLSAAWVHVGGPAPERVDVLVRRGGRRVDPHPARRVGEGPLPPDEVLDLGPCRVTTVQRTGLDVARSAPPEDARPLLLALRARGFSPDLALSAVERLPGERGTRRARAVLASLAG